MNSLSWLLYVADICESLRSALIFFALVAGAAVCVALVIALIHTISAGDCSMGDPEKFALEMRAMKSLKTLKVFLPILGFIVLLRVITPHKETVYAIAASELGEEILHSETANKAQRALNAWLEKQIPNPDSEKPE